ncbi:VOC family protein [Paracoccus aerius]
MESALYAEDLEAATRFWRDVMGLDPFQTVPGRHVFSGWRRGRSCWSSTPPQPGSRRGPMPACRSPHGAHGPGHFCLAVAPEQLEPWRTHLIAKGIPIEADFHWPNGARSIYVRDPAGNSIELADPAIWG